MQLHEPVHFGACLALDMKVEVMSLLPSLACIAEILFFALSCHNLG